MFIHVWNHFSLIFFSISVPVCSILFLKIILFFHIFFTLPNMFYFNKKKNTFFILLCKKIYKIKKKQKISRSSKRGALEILTSIKKVPFEKKLKWNIKFFFLSTKYFYVWTFLRLVCFRSFFLNNISKCLDVKRKNIQRFLFRRHINFLKCMRRKKQ